MPVPGDCDRLWPIVSPTALELVGAIGGASPIRVKPLFRGVKFETCLPASKPCQTRLKREKRANLSMYD
jgi:hypothetical protein